jgi:hypothetical protein
MRDVTVDTPRHRAGGRGAAAADFTCADFHVIVRTPVGNVRRAVAFTVNERSLSNFLHGPDHLSLK